jgi:THUMP domain-like
LPDRATACNPYRIGMDLATFHRLISPEGRAALLAATELVLSESTVLAGLDRLRKHWDADLARAAVETVLLRSRAKAKFARAAEMFFTREALEQASGEIVSGYRAKRFAGFDPVADLGSGIGGDAIALGNAGRKVVAFETDPVRAAMTEENLRVNGLSADVRVADVLAADVAEFGAAYCDPSRRAGGKRVRALADYRPVPSAVAERFLDGFPIAFKLAPGVRIEDAIPLAAELEFLSVAGELKECVAWRGPLRTAHRRATVLPAGDTLAAESLPPAVEVTPIREYLFDPNPAVIRADLVDLLAANFGVTRFDHFVAGLTGDSPISSPFVTAYRVEQVLPFHVRKVGEWLKGRGIGRVTPVKCGADVDTDSALKHWKLSGSNHRYVIFTRSETRVVAVVAERMGE